MSTEDGFEELHLSLPEVTPGAASGSQSAGAEARRLLEETVENLDEFIGPIIALGAKVASTSDTVEKLDQFRNLADWLMVFVEAVAEAKRLSASHGRKPPQEVLLAETAMLDYMQALFNSCSKGWSSELDQLLTGELSALLGAWQEIALPAFIRGSGQ